MRSGKRLLAAAVLIHLFVLIVSNVGGVYNLTPVKAACDPWERATGNRQGWELFARGRMPYAVFLTTDLKYADGESARYPSRFEPIPNASEPRLPGLHNRLFNLEMNLVLEAEFFTPESAAAEPDAWRDILRNAAMRKRGDYLEYLHRVARRERPEVPLKEGTLQVQRYAHGKKLGEFPWFRAAFGPSGDARCDYYDLVDRVWKDLPTP